MAIHGHQRSIVESLANSWPINHGAKLQLFFGLTIISVYFFLIFIGGDKMIIINYLYIVFYTKSDSSFAPIRVENPVCRSAECRFSVKIQQPRLQIRSIGFSRSEPVLPAEGERGWLEVEVIYLGVESGDVGFAYLPDADDVLEIESGIKPTFSIQEVDCQRHDVIG